MTTRGGLLLLSGSWEMMLDLILFLGDPSVHCASLSVLVGEPGSTLLLGEPGCPLLVGEPGSALLVGEPGNGFFFGELGYILLRGE